MFKHSKLFGLIFLILIVLTACGQSTSREEIVVFGAASMTDVLVAAKDRYEEHHPDVDIVLNLAGTNTLLNQLKNGAEVDIFISANESYKDDLYAFEVPKVSGLFARNKMVLIVSNQSDVIHDMSDLVKPHRLVLANGNVPAGIYGRALIANHNKAFGQTYESMVIANLISEESNVRQVYTKVLLGEADAGLVYASDVKEEDLDDLSVVQIEDDYNIKTSSYIMEMLRDGHQSLSDDFYNFLINECNDIIENKGFESIE